MPYTSYGWDPFGIREVYVSALTGGTWTQLPASQTMRLSPQVVSGELSGDDATKSVHSSVKGADWELGAGGISLEAMAVLYGQSLDYTTGAGLLTGQIATHTVCEGDPFPWIKLEGRALGSGGDDIHVRIRKAKVTKPDNGEMSEGKFLVTKITGVAVDDGLGIYSIIQNQAAYSAITGF